MEAVKTPFQRHLLAGAKNHNTQCINDITTYINVKRVDLKSIYYLCNMVTPSKESRSGNTSKNTIDNMQKILFVCLGNICRSPMAEYIMKKMVNDAGREGEFEISSAATSDEVVGYDIYPPAKDCLRLHNIPFEKRGARQVTQADYDHYDLIFTMDRDNQQCMKRMFRDDEGKIRMLMSLAGKDQAIPDPWYTGDFESTYRDICEALGHFLKEKSK